MMVRGYFIALFILFSYFHPLPAASWTDAWSEDDFSRDHSYEEFDQICSSQETYTVRKVLGEGAFGKVYAVEDSNGQPFALKSYKSYLSSYGLHPMFDLWSDIKREFFIGQILDHPHIVKTFDFFEEINRGDHTSFLVLQLIDGKTVRKTPKRSKLACRSLEDCLNLIEALEYAFQFDLLFIDLHEENLMLSDEKGIMLIDLASFMTVDDIFSYVVSMFSSPSNASVCSLSPRAGIFSFSSDSKKVLPPNQEKKIQSFLFQNFSMIEKIWNAKIDCEVRSLLPHFGATVGATSEWESPILGSEEIANYIYANYFENIAQMCCQLIDKCDLDRKERIEWRANISKLIWNFQEDVEEGRDSQLLDDYLSQLKALIKCSAERG